MGGITIAGIQKNIIEIDPDSCYHVEDKRKNVCDGTLCYDRTPAPPKRERTGGKRGKSVTGVEGEHKGSPYGRGKNQRPEEMEGERSVGWAKGDCISSCLQCNGLGFQFCM